MIWHSLAWRALALAAALPAAAAISQDPTGPTVTVETPPALEQAYLDLSAWANGGGTILIDPRFPALAEIALQGGGDNPVHITSADPETPVRVSGITLRDVDNLRLSRLHVDSTGLPRDSADPDIEILRSTRIEITGSTFTSNGSPVYRPDDPSAVLGARLSMIRQSEIITVSGNRISGGHEQGLIFRESTGIRISGNEITAIQGDGIRLIGVGDVRVEGNHLYDFSATPHEFTHSDFIQVWARNGDTPSRDVTITGNVLDTGNGVAVQGIWVGNTVYVRGDTGHVHRNITIANNLIYTGAANGIGLTGAEGVRIEGNTLLWNTEAFTIKEDSDDTSFFPRIRLHEDIADATVSGNITTRILHGAGARVEGNILVSWTPGDPNYVGLHFAGAATGGDIGPEGWRLRADSPWIGTGATAAQP